ncbi:TIGR02281 family clan AA aspartic protease [Alteromonas sediminis]|uniref:TIGR02281 family clan AA aspartic protease n=1 Tax=Alteromonas sediminis TaxID=2259342 RepID=A0A3N5ZA69_9ALTE|nr:TIGR02281 family clan AA aspartic protease [Alteromonas sediminis]RPJ67964.1 TIGR02281 family clan AA aspartic protease [Alteromonas sediminis]
MDTEPDSAASSAKWMILLAWVCAIGICAWAFSGLLERQHNPNMRVESNQVGSNIEVQLKQNRQGHYVANGKINGETVTFLVDTGATSVSVPAHLSEKLGLRPLGRGIARTANGNVEIAFTRIAQLELGDIMLNNVDASINPGMRDDHILLGMSVLRQLEFTQRGEWLILRTL